MGNYIYMDDQAIESCIASLRDDMKHIKTCGGVLKLERKLEKKVGRATVQFTPVAWAKMWALMHKFKKEVGWYGFCRREEAPFTYTIYDIAVYPQETTSSTIDMDPGEFDEWRNKNFSEDLQHDMRMHGHSHYNFGVSPSSTDIDHQKEIIKQFRKDTYYIFMIYNMKAERNVWVYDMPSNTMFNNDEVDVKILCNEMSTMDAFLLDADLYVRDKKYTPPASSYSSSDHYEDTTYYSGKYQKKRSGNASREEKMITGNDLFEEDADPLYSCDQWLNGENYMRKYYGRDYYY